MSARLNRLISGVRELDHTTNRAFLPPELNTRELPVTLMERKAYALSLVMARMPIVIGPDEMIVGSRTLFTALADKNPSHVGMFALPGYATAEEVSHLGGKVANAGKEGGDEPFYAVFQDSEGSAVGHNVAGYENILKDGIGGILRRAAKSEDTCAPSVRPFLHALRIVYTALSGLILRYADLALVEAETASKDRREELTRIVRCLRHIASKPPRDMFEAIQLYWMTHVALLIESGASLCYGRIDQILAPYEATATDEELIEWIGCLIVKINELSDVDIGDVKYAGTDNLVIGGVRPDGTPGENRITRAYLEAVGITRLVAPELSVRLHKRTPGWLMDKTVELVASGINHIALYNDEVYVPNLCSAGIRLEDARDYSIDLCQDVSIGGRSAFFLGGQLSMAHTLLETLAETRDDITYEDFISAYKKNLSKAVLCIVHFCNDAEKTPGAGCVTCVYTENRKGADVISPLPLFSGTCEGTVEQGLDVTQGGLRYGHKGINLFTPTNAINALAAIRIAVYEEKFTTLSEIKAALKTNYQGYEPLRKRLAALPKWGNDDDRVDVIGKDIVEYGLNEIRRHKTRSGDSFLAGIHQPYNRSFGRTLRATPDGRRDGETVPVGISPMNGTDRKGVTAVFMSLAKLNKSLCQWNNALALKFTPRLFSGSGKEKFAALLRVFVELDLMELQINTLDNATLRRAQAEPEAHAGIMVRVWGYSAYFTQLPPDLQDEIIERTQQEILT